MKNKVATEADKALEFFKLFAPATEANVKKEDLVKLGKATWRLSYEYTRDDSELNRVILERIEEVESVNPIQAEVLRASFRIPDQNIMSLGAARWVDQGLPVIRLGHKRAAAMLATNINQDNLDYIKPPFPAFLIEVPDGLLSTTDADGSIVGVKSILVHHMNLKNAMHVNEEYRIEKEDCWRWRWVAITGTRLIQWQMNRKLEELAGFNIRASQYDGFGFPIEERDDRTSRLVGRLICATCLVMSNPEDIKTSTQPVFRDGKKPLKGSPEYKVYSLETPIKVDMRAAVAAYLRGERENPNVRHMVRGHFKPNLGARLGRIVWVHPYPRGGDETDPLMQKVYKVEEV